jgi:hypothetical protein
LSLLLIGSERMIIAQETERMSASHQDSLKPTVQLLPEVNRWPYGFQTPTNNALLALRAQLDLPTDRPIVASGHQPIVFHPGIVAKLITLDHVAKRSGSASIWIVPDQDVVDPGLVRTPTHADGFLDEHMIRLGGESNLNAPSAVLPAIEMNQDLPEALSEIASWLMGYEHEASIAKQFASATIGYLCELLDLKQPTLIYASDLIPSEAGSAIIDAMLEDPRTAATMYNQSVEQHPDAGVRPLMITEESVELPLWRVEAHARTQVIVRDGDSIDRMNLMPTGLLMTAIMRTQLCELFIHGLGGYEYDQITEHWIRNWMGEELAPAVGASATMTIEHSSDHDIPEPAQAAWIAHHAKHDPSMLGDSQAAAQKAELVQAIKSAKVEGNRDRAASLFAQMQSLLEDTRSTNAKALEQFRSDAQNARRASRSKELAADRTWGFPFYTHQQLQSLKDEVVSALDVSR